MSHLLCVRRALASLILLVACDSPVVGTWQSDGKLPNGERNELEVFAAFEAEATIWATPKSDPAYWIEFKFDAKWEDDGDEFDFELECDSPTCTEADQFKMECQAIEEEDGDEKLDCKADDASLWKDYPFDFERKE